MRALGESESGRLGFLGNKRKNIYHEGDGEGAVREKGEKQEEQDVRGVQEISLTK